MDYTLLVAAILLGSILGSFLNALLFRFNTGRSVLRGRSACMQCGHTLSAADLVPVFSYIYVRGKCRYCHSKISWQYPVIELLAAALAGVVYVQHGLSFTAILSLVVWLVLLFLVVYDLRHQILPWSALGLLAALGLVLIFLQGFSWLAVLSGPVIAAPFLLLALVSGGRWMGWGDAPLGLGLGWFLGLTAGLTAVVLAFWIGAAVGVALVLSSKRVVAGKSGGQSGYTMKSEVPFAPFLVAGAACTYFLHVDFFQILPALLF